MFIWVVFVLRFLSTVAINKNIIITVNHKSDENKSSKQSPNSVFNYYVNFYLEIYLFMYTILPKRFIWTSTQYACVRKAASLFLRSITKQASNDSLNDSSCTGPRTRPHWNWRGRKAGWCYVTRMSSRLEYISIGQAFRVFILPASTWEL